VALGFTGRVHTGSRRSSALIVVVWVIGILSMLVASFAFDAQVEARITSYYRKRTQAESLARAGIVVAEMLTAKAERMGDDEEPDLDDRWFEAAKRLKEGSLRGLEEKMGNGTIRLDIVPEPARRNINNLDVANNKNTEEVERHLERVLEVGGITEEMWADFIDPLIDWLDADGTSRGEPAETDDYYAALDPPYSAKNGPLDTVGELLLVKNFDRTVLYGGVVETGVGTLEPIRISGIEDLLTTYGDGKVNVNAASMRVLMTLPEIDELIAGAIIEERDGLLGNDSGGDRTPFENPADLCTRMGLPVTLKKFVATDSTIYRISSVGIAGGVEREVWCIAHFTKQRLRILRWREQD